MDIDTDFDLIHNKYLNMLCKITNIEICDIVDTTMTKLKYPKISNKPIKTFIKNNEALKIMITRLFLRFKLLEKKHLNRLKKYNEYNNMQNENSKINDDSIRLINYNNINIDAIAKMLPQNVILKELIRYELCNCIPKQKYNIHKMQLQEICSIIKKEIERFSCVLYPDIIEDKEWTIINEHNKLFKIPDSYIILANTTQLSTIPKIMKNMVSYIRQLCKYDYINCFLHEDINYDIYWFIFAIKNP